MCGGGCVRFCLVRVCVGRAGGDVSVCVYIKRLCVGGEEEVMMEEVEGSE